MADGAQCELCRCSGAEAAAKAAERGPGVAAAFPSGLREGYCCQCYDQLVGRAEPPAPHTLGYSIRKYQEG